MTLNVNMPSAAKRQRQEHAIEWSYQWQYAVTHWTLRDQDPEHLESLKRNGPPPELMTPPPQGSGNKWQLNIDCGHGGYSYAVPRWSTDIRRALQQRTHWRRPAPHISWTSPDRMISINRGDT